MHPFLWASALGGLSLALAAGAQSRADDPTNPAAVVPPLRYQSAFDGYRPLGDVAIGNWRGVNDRVREAAEHAARGAGSAPPSASSSPATPLPKTAPAPGSREHHGGKP